MAQKFVKMFFICYALATILTVQVDCFRYRYDGPPRRYRYEPVTRNYQQVPTVVTKAPFARSNIPTRPVLQEVKAKVPIQATLPVTFLQDRVTSVESQTLPLFNQIIHSKVENSISSKAEHPYPLGHTAVSPYFADPDGETGAPSPPDTKAADLIDNQINLCPSNTTGCDPNYPWRKIDGSCNNLANPHFGASNQPMPRLLGAKFDLGMVRTFAEDGSLLPNPRFISTGLNLPPRRSTNHNLIVMQIGQFVDHDQILTSHVLGPDGESRQCKSCKSWTDPVCMPIPIPSDDPFFPSHSEDGERNCLPFNRNVVFEGKYQTVDPVNFNTGFLDLSTVYASDHCQCDELRLFRYGLMRMEQPWYLPKGFPPVGFGGFEDCRLKSNKCMVTGDARGNEHLILLVFHTIFLREHNRIAKKLFSINKHWEDERIFQEARRINIAQYQHSIYAEYLPVFLGFSKTREYRLQPLDRGYYEGYSEEVNPGIVNEFAGAAYRIGHSMVPKSFKRFSKDFQYVDELSLIELFHNPEGFDHPRIFDECVRGLLGSRLPALDLHFEAAVKNHLFEFSDKSHSGEDLIARNIARGREFGFPGYINYVKHCGISNKIKTWTDLYTLMDPVVVKYLQSVYKHPKDIDLFVGGMSEYQTPGALIGPTFSCIIANQFIAARRGDRFWYENEENGLTLPQLDSIRKTSRWSKIICKNMNELGPLPYYSTIIPIQSLNPLVRCDQFEDLDFNLWKEPHQEPKKSCEINDKIYQIGEKVPISICSSCICNANGNVKCVAANVNCQSLSESDHLDESCLLICDPATIEQTEGGDKNYLGK